MQTKASQETVTSQQNLNQRIHANKRALKDFDEWCVQQFPEVPIEANIVDLGCGTGKQLHLFSSFFGPKSTFWGIDIANKSLNQLKAQYESKPSLHLIEGSFDEEKAYTQIGDHSIDLAYACYALYYTKALSSVLSHAYRILKPGGILWVVGPTSGTNQQFLDILRPLHEVEPFMDYVFDEFMPEVVATASDLGFQSVKPARLHNQVFFPSAAAFMNYLRHSLFYREGHDEAIAQAVQAVCDAEGRFTVSKHVLSIQLRK